MDNRNPVICVRMPAILTDCMDKYRSTSPLYKTRSDVVRYALFKLFEKDIKARREAIRRRREARRAYPPPPEEP